MLHNPHIVVCVRESFFLFARSLHPLATPHIAVSLLSIYESWLYFSC